MISYCVYKNEVKNNPIKFSINSYKYLIEKFKISKRVFLVNCVSNLDFSSTSKEKHFLRSYEMTPFLSSRRVT